MRRQTADLEQRGHQHHYIRPSSCPQWAVAPLVHGLSHTADTAVMISHRHRAQLPISYHYSKIIPTFYIVKDTAFCSFQSDQSQQPYTTLQTLRYTWTVVLQSLFPSRTARGSFHLCHAHWHLRRVPVKAVRLECCFSLMPSVVESIHPYLEH